MYNYVCIYVYIHIPYFIMLHLNNRALNNRPLNNRALNNRALNNRQTNICILDKLSDNKLSVCDQKKTINITRKINRSICANNIDDIDKLNTSGSLEGVTFYKVQDNALKNNHLSTVHINSKTKVDDIDYHTEKYLELSMLDSESESNSEFESCDHICIKNTQNIECVEDNLIGSDKIDTSELKNRSKPTNGVVDITLSNILSKNQIDIAKIHDNINSSAFMYYSKFFELDDTKISFAINVKGLVKEICMVLFFHLFLGINNATFNVITIDGILSCIIFYMSYIGVNESDNYFLRIRLMAIDRYIYYLLLFCGYYLFNYMTWYCCITFSMYCVSIMICPSIMGYIYNMYSYKKIRHVLYNGYNKLIQKIVCKQLSKIINLLIENVFNLDINVGYEDLIPFYNQFSLSVINRFIVTFITACIFNHVDKGGMKVPIMIYKNLYMKETKYNIASDKSYLYRLIVDKQWSKFMDIYTLNRIIRLVVNDNTHNSMMTNQVSTFLKYTIFRFNRIMFCWTVMNISNLTIGVLSFFMFISGSDRPLRYLINTCLFAFLSFFTTERLLVILLCEACYPIINSKILTDVADDVHGSLKRGFLSVYYRTRLESVLLSIILFSTSFNNNNIYGIITVCIINLIIILRMASRLSIFNSKPVEDIISMAYVDKLIQHPINILTSLSTLLLTVFGVSIDSDKAMANSQDKVQTNSQDKVHDNTKQSPNDIVGIPKPESLIFKTLNVSMHSSDHRSTSLDCNNVPNPNKIIRTLSGGLHSLVGMDMLASDMIDINRINTSQLMIDTINNIENTDMLLILKDRFKIMLKNNLLIRVINPFATITTNEIVRIFAHIIILLILGCISNFQTEHIIFLPIMVQNVIDILF